MSDTSDITSPTSVSEIPTSAPSFALPVTQRAETNSGAVFFE